MKTLLLLGSTILSLITAGQITSPVVRAYFGVDADQKARNVNGVLQASDDWFLFPSTTGTAANGTFVIDTTGAAAVKAGYAADVSPYPNRMATFYRSMSQPQFSVINNKLWLDAMFVRDFHGNDRTVFTSGSDKNGMSPANWTGGIQSIPDKNDILDMFVHVRRSGPTSTDSLWFFGGLSLDNVTGNRYFDFEMYQSDIYYDLTSAKFYGYGPDAGHTTWVFDAAGNVIKPGDIIFTAEYQSASLTNIEARIWINKNSLSITPTAFNWSGQFDGDGSGAQYGYASILPKTAGAFYTGLQCGNNEWAGAFQLVLQDNSIANNYIAKQFMEFSVNLSKLGLDPVTLLGGDICGTPFNRIVVKTRASASFTAELKDFVAPLDLFLAPRVAAVADVPLFCGKVGVSDIWVQNPYPTSYYSWTTTDGHIVGSNIGQKITVDSPGTYIVKQQLAAGCNPYAYDTITITFDAGCFPMATSITTFKGIVKEDVSVLDWATKANKETEYFEVQRSTNGKDFETVSRINGMGEGPNEAYSFTDDIRSIQSPFVFYRLRIKVNVGSIVYSNVLRLGLPSNQKDIQVFPNPVTENLQLSIPSIKGEDARITVYGVTGQQILVKDYTLKKGENMLQINATNWNPGTYIVNIATSGQNQSRKFVVSGRLSSKF